MTRSKVPPEKRIRVAHACSRCKRRKEKCSGEVPCKNCLKAGVDCSSNMQTQMNPAEADAQFEPPSKKQRTASTASTASASSVKSVESLASTISTASTDGITTSDDIFKFDVPTNIRSPSGLPSPIITPTVERKLNFGNARRSISSEVSPFETTVSKPCRHKRSTITHMASRLRNILVPQTEQSQPTLCTLCNKLPSSRVAELDLMEVGMPTYDEMTCLLPIFRTHVAAILEPTLISYFTSSLKTPTFANHPPNRHCISQLVLAIAYQSIPQASSSLKRKFSSMTPSKARKHASTHFRNAKAGFDMSAAIETGDVSAAEVLILMAVYKFLETDGEDDDYNAASGYCALAISISHSLSLHQHNPMTMKPDLHSSIYISLYNLDRLLSLVSKRPLSISRDQNTHIPPSLRTSTHKLSNILGKILHSVPLPSSIFPTTQHSHSRSTDPTTLHNLAQELKQFYESIAHKHRWSTILASKSTVSEKDFTRSLQIHAVYFVGVYILTLPAVIESFKNSISILQNATQSSENKPSIAEKLKVEKRDKWTLTAMQISKTSLEMYERTSSAGVTVLGDVLGETWLAMSFLVGIIGCFVQLSYVTSTGVERETAEVLDDLERQIAALRNLYDSLSKNPSNTSSSMYTVGMTLTDATIHAANLRSSNDTSDILGSVSVEAAIEEINALMKGEIDSPTYPNANLEFDVDFDSLTTPEYAYSTPSVDDPVIPQVANPDHMELSEYDAHLDHIIGKVPDGIDNTWAGLWGDETMGNCDVPIDGNVGGFTTYISPTHGRNVISNGAFGKPEEWQEIISRFRVGELEPWSW